MIEQLDQIITAILGDGEAPDQLKSAAISFDIPQQGYAPEKDTVNIYLYDVHENRQLRDPVPIVKLVNGKYQKRKPPLRVDCSYMVTAWNGTKGDQSIADEHRILSQALIWLSRFSVISEKHLPDDWKKESQPTYQPFPVYMSVAQMNGVKEPGEFWTALGSPPRPFLNVVVTITMDISQKPKDIGSPVISRKIKTGQKQEDKEKLVPGTEEELIIPKPKTKSMSFVGGLKDTIRF